MLQHFLGKVPKCTAQFSYQDKYQNIVLEYRVVSRQQRSDLLTQAKRNSQGKRPGAGNPKKQEESSPVTREAAYEQAFRYENRTRQRNRSPRDCYRESNCPVVCMLLLWPVL